MNILALISFIVAKALAEFVHRHVSVGLRAEHSSIEDILLQASQMLTLEHRPRYRFPGGIERIPLRNRVSFGYWEKRKKLLSEFDSEMAAVRLVFSREIDGVCQTVEPYDQRSLEGP